MTAETRETSEPSPLPPIGWREYVGLPALGIDRIKAKVDTGARTSALHAINILYVFRAGETWVQFDVHPIQRNTKRVVHCEAPLVEERYVCDSGGKRTLRPVIETAVLLNGKKFKLELTLISRDEMGFRMLIGRQAVRGRFVVDPGQSFLGGRRKKKKTKRKKVKRTKAGKPRTTP